jgi:hypothetical protein
MSWLFSQALVEEYLGGGYLDGEQSVQLNGNHTQLAYLPPDRMTAFSRLSRFGMTFRPLTESRGEELLTLFRAGFHAKTSAAQEGAQELKAVDQVCGSTWHELSVRYDLDSHSWKTHQCLWDEALQWSSVTLPRWGMTVNGVLFQHPTAERPINETGSGFWPTPTACDHKGTSDPMQAEKVLERGYSHNLSEAVAYSRKWPTPQASDNRDRGNLGSGAIQRRQEKGKQIMLSQSVSDISGALNPLWVEWLMGWPLGWTDLKPLETDRFQSWQQQYSGFYQEQQSND